MVRTQISLSEDEYAAAKREARRLGISLAELLRRSLRTLLPVNDVNPWMRYAGMVETGDPSSSRRIDDVSVDVVGGKIPVDRLVQAEILVGDSAKWLEREAAWEPCEPGEGRVIVEVYDLPASLATPPSGRGKSKR